MIQNMLSGLKEECKPPEGAKKKYEDAVIQLVQLLQKQVDKWNNKNSFGREISLIIEGNHIQLRSNSTFLAGFDIIWEFHLTNKGFDSILSNTQGLGISDNEWGEIRAQLHVVNKAYIQAYPKKDGK